MLLLIIVLISAGAGCILYPDMVYLLASQKQGQVIEDYQVSTEEMNQQRMDEEYQNATNYNERGSIRSLEILFHRTYKRNQRITRRFLTSTGQWECSRYQK